MIRLKSSSVTSNSAALPQVLQIAFRLPGYQKICCPDLMLNPQEHFPEYRAVSQKGLFPLCFRRLFIRFVSLCKRATISRSPVGSLIFVG
jgi:hypothetical protein